MHGPDCVLLIVSILSDAQLSRYIKLAEKLKDFRFGLRHMMKMR